MKEKDKKRENRKNNKESGTNASRAVHTDIKSVRKNERSIRVLKRILAVLIVLFVGLGIYVTYPMWLPKLEGIFDKPASTITNDGQLAGGNFPIEPDDAASSEIYAVKNNLLVADSHTLKFYDENGKERGSYSHEFSNPVVRVSGKRVLVFDSGSVDFKMYNKSGEVYSKSADNDILTGALGEDGTAAILTSNEKYPSVLLIYDEDGKLIYRYNSIQRIMSMAVDSDGRGCYVSTFSSENGEIYSQVRRLEFDTEKEKMISDKLDCLAIDCMENSAGNIFVIGDNKTYILNGDGQIVSVSEYSGDFSGYVLDRDCAAIMLSGNTKSSGVLIIADADAKSDETFREISGVESARSLKIYDKRLIVLTSSEVYSYAFSGTLAATAKLSHDYSDCVYINSGIYLLGRGGIDKIGYEM